jgi:serine/threonine protein kinase
MTADTVMCDEDYLYIVMPFCRGGDLCQRVAEVDRFSEDDSRFWFRQILQVRGYCSLGLTIGLTWYVFIHFKQSPPITGHRVLKPCNALEYVTETCHPRTS